MDKIEVLCITAYSVIQFILIIFPEVDVSLCERVDTLYLHVAYFQIGFCQVAWLVHILFAK